MDSKSIKVFLCGKVEDENFALGNTLATPFRENEIADEGDRVTLIGSIFPVFAI